MIKTKYFDIRELVPRSVHTVFRDKSWMFLRPDALESLDQIRAMFGVCLVNNWHLGGSNENRGFRSANSVVGARYSAHRLGAAFDVTCTNATGEEMRQYILSNQDKFALIKRIELNVVHLHFDVLNVDTSKGIVTFKP